MLVKLLAVVLAIHLGTSLKYNRRNLVETAWNLNETFFPPLMHEVSRSPAPPAAAGARPWLARVTPTQFLDHPTFCTAACVRRRIFLTSARCLIGLTVGYASVVYKEKILQILTIVVPKPEDKSKQYFDDVGLIVTKPLNKKTPIEWETVDLIDVNRTDDGFQWFADLAYEDGPIQHELLAYYDSLDEKKQIKRQLLALPVVVGIKFCQKIYSRNHELNGYFVPCVLACTYEQFLQYDQHDNCKKHIAIEGSVVYNTETKKLLGIATWAGKEIKQGQVTKLPVGFAVANSRNFWKDFECALKIRDYVGEVYDGFFQKLCDEEHHHHHHHHSGDSSSEGQTSLDDTTLGA